jgi:hypothetical protein
MPSSCKIVANTITNDAEKATTNWKEAKRP